MMEDHGKFFFFFLAGMGLVGREGTNILLKLRFLVIYYYYI